MMRVVYSDDLHYIETPGGNAGAAVATPSRGAVEVSVVRQRQSADSSNPEHSHDREEVITVLAGEITVAVAGAPVVLRPGDTVIVPPQTPHQIRNSGSQPAEWLLIAPAGVGFFHADGAPASPPWAR
jgi:quercetin dioxygenase-like cupin family protein